MIKVNLIRAGKNSAQKVTFVFFHHAGGQSTMFYRWQNHLPEHCTVYAVQLSARQQILENKPDNCFHRTVAEISSFIENNITGDLMLFGHSLGGLVAFSTAVYLEKSGWEGLRHLFVSGCAAPHRFYHRNLKSFSDQAMFDEILSYGGVPPEILREKELADFFLPTIRADLLLLDDFIHMDVAEHCLNIPIHAFLGTKDDAVSESRVKDWSGNTNKSFDLTLFDGDHFYLQQDYPKICATMCRESLVLHPPSIECC